MHKRVCSEDPSIKPHVPIEMAVERVLKRLPSQETAPADATCYICLDHDSKLVRGCACRGDSAGFVHLKCLIELAERNEKASMSRSFLRCINCKQEFTGALQLQLTRRWWRRHRNESVESMPCASCIFLGRLLLKNDEGEAERCLNEASLNTSRHLGVLERLNLASRIARERPEEGLKLIEKVVSQAKQDDDTAMVFTAQHQYIDTALLLERYEEIVAMATECLEFVKTYFGDSSDPLLMEQKYIFLDRLAFACGMTGRFDESKRAFDEVIASHIRTFGREHEKTRNCFRTRAILLQKTMDKAQDLVGRDVANGARYLDAVLIESKACDFFDAKDPNVQINCTAMAMAANVLGKIGRLQESVAVARLCLKSARERKDLDSEPTQRCMRNYAAASYDLHGPTKESKQVLDELLAIQIRLYGSDAPQTQETVSFICSLQH